MNVVYGADDNYAFLLGVSLISLFETNRNVEEINTYIISDGIKDVNLGKINLISLKYNRNIEIINSYDIEAKIEMKIDVSDWSMVAYARLFLSSMINVDRILWIDCDTIINSDLQELWHTKLNNNLCAACIDSSSWFKRLNGFGSEELYYNTGVLLVDLRAWRENEIESLLIDTLRRQGGVSCDVDQGIINIALKNKIMTLPEKYNVISNEYIYGIEIMDYRNSWNDTEFYDISERRQAMENPAIIHFVGHWSNQFRPWISGCIHPKRDLWQYYKNISPWHDMELKKVLTKYKDRFKFWLSMKFPKFNRFLLETHKKLKSKE